MAEMNEKPKRIQRKRTAGFNLQAASPNGLPVIYVGRSGRSLGFGNPFKIGAWYAPGENQYGHYFDNGHVTRENCLMAFEAYCIDKLCIDDKWLEPLRGKNLACWCKEGSPCHADILLHLANS